MRYRFLILSGLFATLSLLSCTASTSVKEQATDSVEISTTEREPTIGAIEPTDPDKYLMDNDIDLELLNQRYEMAELIDPVFWEKIQTGRVTENNGDQHELTAEELSDLIITLKNSVLIPTIKSYRYNTDIWNEYEVSTEKESFYFFHIIREGKEYYCLDSRIVHVEGLRNLYLLFEVVD